MKRLMLLTLILFAALTLTARAQQDPTAINSRFGAARTGVSDAAPIREQPSVAWTRTLAGRPDGVINIRGALIVPSEDGRRGTLNLLDAETGAIQWTHNLPGAPMGSPAYAHGRIILGDSSGRLSAVMAADGTLAWETQVTGLVWGSPLVLDGRVIVAAQTGIYAFDTVTGEQLWRHDARGANFSPVFDGETVIANDRGTVLGLDPETAEERWRVENRGAIWLGAAVLDGMLVLGGDELVALDLATRAVLWTADAGEDGVSGPLLLPDLVVIGSVDGHMRAFDRMTGQPRWEIVTDDWAAADPVYAGGVIYFGIGNHIDETPAPRPLYAVDAATGEILWTHMADGYIFFGVEVADHRLWFGDNAGNVVMLEAPMPDAVSTRGMTRAGRYDDTPPQIRPDAAWEIQLESDALTPLAHDEVLYIPQTSGTLLALEADSGEQLWAYEHPEPMISPVAVAGDAVYFGAGKSSVVAVDAVTGEPRWTAETDAPVWSASPLLIGGAVVTGSEAGTIYAFEQADGTLRWSAQIGDAVLWPLAADATGTAIVAAGWQNLVALDAETGAELWRASTADKWNAPAADAAAFYAGTGENTVVALDRVTGETLWTFGGPRSIAVEWSAPVVTDTAVYIGHSSSNLYALDKATGAELWRTALADWPTADPILADGLLIVGVGSHGPNVKLDSPGVVYALDAATGEVRWTFGVEGLVHAGVAIENGTVFVTTTTGMLYALRGLADA
jgi:outer membrane protein assembly factor BamB